MIQIYHMIPLWILLVNSSQAAEHKILALFHNTTIYAPNTIATAPKTNRYIQSKFHVNLINFAILVYGAFFFLFYIGTIHVEQKQRLFRQCSFLVPATTFTDRHACLTIALLNLPIAWFRSVFFFRSFVHFGEHHGVCSVDWI